MSDFYDHEYLMDGEFEEDDDDELDEESEDDTEKDQVISIA